MSSSNEDRTCQPRATSRQQNNMRASIRRGVTRIYRQFPNCTDLKNCKARSEAGEEGPVIPLLLQNKPPVDENETGELADLHMRPEPVSVEWTVVQSGWVPPVMTSSKCKP